MKPKDTKKKEIQTETNLNGRRSEIFISVNIRKYEQYPKKMKAP
jgi:hypothetical protein